MILRSCRVLRCILLCTAAAADPGWAAQEQSNTLVFSAQTAAIDGREWDRTYPGATTLDAVHRAVLVRFPDSAEAVAGKLASGFSLSRAELVLEYDGYETAPAHYTVRHALGVPKWKANPPQWHVVAWALRRPWVAHGARGPTFNAYLNGAGYWTRYGAADTERDRYPVRLGPSELSAVQPTAQLDLTPLLEQDAYGTDIGRRLRALEEQGLLLKKLESYDARYREPNNAYDWAVPTGGHGLTFRNARLVVTFTDAPGATRIARVALPPRTDVAALAKKLQSDGSGGKPTAVMPSPAMLQQFVQGVSGKAQAVMSPAQRQRVMELYKIGGDRASAWTNGTGTANHKQYAGFVRELLATPPRFWRGWDIQDDLLVWYLYRDILPAYAQEHLKSYWEAWLMPDVPTKELLHPQGDDAIAYWQKTRDWRGRASFFRAGYNHETSTQNFNHIAAMGALLGGNVIGSSHAMADGRHGLEHFPLRLWAMRDGSTQEMLDHYYLSITVSAQKMFADFGPVALDRLMGRIMLDRSIELLATAYHPHLRRLVSASGRARLPGILVEQDGIYGVLHTLSRKGVLNYLDRPIDAKVHGMPVWGRDFPPGRVAVQTIPQKWASDWLTHIIDDKRFPFEETSTDTTRGAFNPPLWRRMYLGRYYGLASQDIKGGTADLLAQWSHKSEPATAMEDLGTLTLRYAVNEPDMATTRGGAMPYAGGMLTYQHRNRAIVCTKPRTQRERIAALAGKGGLTSLASVIALWNFRASPGWEIHVDGRLADTLPARAKAGQLITVRDGVSYLGIIALPATDLGRTDEVVIASGGGGGKAEPNGALVRPALTITSYNFQKETPTPFEALDWPQITTAAYGGFVIELGDAAEYGDYSAFVKRMRANQVSSRWDARAKLLHVEYRSGRDVMEIGCSTDYPQSDAHYPLPPGQQTKAIAYRRVNGKWPYLPPGIDRDTSTAQQGTSGSLEKNGALLRTEAGRKAYLQTEPITGVYVAYNPLPDPTNWSFSTPGGISVEADGKVSLLRVGVEPTRNRLSVDHAVKAGQSGPGMAANLLVSGFSSPPAVVRNGAAFVSPLRTLLKGGRAFYVVPLAAE